MGIENDLRDIRGSLAERVLLCVHRVGVTTSGDIANALTAEAGAEPVEQMAVIQATSWLRQLNLAEESTSLGGEFDLTARGQQAARLLTERKGNTHMRVQECANAMLKWLDSDDSGHFPGTDDFQGTEFDSIAGGTFSEAEVHRTAAWLEGHGLVKGVMANQADYPLRVDLTHAGNDCLHRFGGDVGRWLDRSQVKVEAGASYSTTITGSPGAQSMAGSPGGSQVSTTAVRAEARGPLADLADQLLSQARNLGLGAGAEEELISAAAGLREVADDPNGDVDRARTLLNKVAGAAAVAAGTEAGQHVMQMVAQGISLLTG